ncbi:MAG: class I SAM-dependent methyltransferase [Spirochaetaceae bacterium]|jgi:2-polyprenyl-3-methyl-5-hydroxy-6-metoxy-1,4-benzoquinol methylase/spore coat polysaccharide biosynthesis predicted glycosyltransferase SpsG|nr:class I SAM-dependent methyltransferase [Spirochaetaceae bacterium]
MKNILCAASFEIRRGTGHLVRSALLVNALTQKGINARLYIPSLNSKDGRTLSDAKKIITQNEIDPDKILLSTKESAEKQKWDLIILDLFRTEEEEAVFFYSLAPVLAVDEGGKFRGRFDFIIDLLPVYSKISPNITAPYLLPLPSESCNVAHNRKAMVDGNGEQLKILISFGGEDAQGMGSLFAKAISSPLCDVTLISGTLNSKNMQANSAKNTIVPYIANLKDKLCEYDLLITHFGITAFQALKAGIMVMLASPTTLHKKTGQYAGFFVLGGAKNCASKVEHLLLKNSGGNLNFDFLRQLSDICAGLTKKYGLLENSTGFAEYAESLHPQTTRFCRICGSENSIQKEHHSVCARFADRSYRLCPVCGMHYLNRLNEAPIEYGEDYFFEQYKKQYGKTYLEDFPSLLEQGVRRLGNIKNIAHNKNGSLLDIGCAYGAFLQAAMQEGFNPFGIDISKQAVNYVVNTLKIPAEEFNFAKTDLCENSVLKKQFDVVTLWYVIEHFENIPDILLKINSLLKSNGVLAFSTPSGSGISARVSFKKFLYRSPSDHFTILNPHRIKKLLKQFGFKAEKIVITGYHPERFPLASRLTNTSSILYKLLLFISRLFKLGDTFEVYAVKSKQRTKSS